MSRQAFAHLSRRTASQTTGTTEPPPYTALQTHTLEVRQTQGNCSRIGMTTKDHTRAGNVQLDDAIVAIYAERVLL
jgi:hypothetical protein